MKRVVSNIKFNSFASIVPKNIMSNEDIISNAPESEKLYLRKTAENVGVISRYCVVDETFESLAYDCSIRLIKEQGIDLKTIKSIVLVSQTTSSRLPSSARILHGKLGLSSNCATFDINDGCSGFIYASFLSSLILDKPGDKSLIIAGDIISNRLEKSDFSNQLLMGDGLSATIIEKVNDENDISFILGSDGKNAGKIQFNPDNSGFFEMEGFDVFAFTMRILPKLLEEALDLSNKTLDEIDYFFLHQANKMILDKFEKKMKLDPLKNIRSIKNFGNTGPGSIPITVANSAITLEGSVCMLGFGAGLSWGSLVTQDFNPKVYSFNKYESSN